VLEARSIPKIARWAAAAAIVTVLAVAAMLTYRARRTSRTAQLTPAAVPSSVEQRSLKFTFSKVDGEQTVFTIRAAQATQFSHNKPSLLQDVDIVVYGAHGERHDEIHTRSCDYEPSTGGVVCHGKVQLDLSSAPVPSKPAKESSAGIHIEASGVGFNRDTGEATSDAPLEFRFPQGNGQAVGVRYSSRRADLTLERNVQLTLAPDRPGGLPTHVQAQGGLSYDRKSGRVVLRGPVEISRGGRTLETAGLTLNVDTQMRPQRAVADGRVKVRMDQGARSGSFEADHVEIGFDGQGRAEKIDASGNVLANEQAPASMRLAAQWLAIALDPLDQQPRTVDAAGDVRLSSTSGSGSERLATNALHLTAVPVMAGERTVRRGAAARAEEKAAAVRLDRATSGGPAVVVWRKGDERLRLDAKRLSAAFDEDNRIRELDGRAGVRLEKWQAGKEPVVSTANALVAHFVENEWSDAEESGNVRATQGTRTASADRARLTRSEDEMELKGAARVSDPMGQTLADDIIWYQQSGQLRAAGHVRSTYFANAKGETGVAPSAGPANVVAKTLVADPKAGEAMYSGDARLWQGDLAIQADRIDLRRASGELVAQGNVMGAFPQEPHELGETKQGVKASRKAPSGPVLWRVRANRLTYVTTAGGTRKEAKGKPGEAVLDGGVEAWSSDGKIDAEKLVLKLQRDNSGRAELAQATALGGVKFQQGKRWGQGEKLVYLAEPGKIVLTGGQPSLHDTTGNLVRGDQLTFYVADDTILVESSKGSRTLTRHPIPN
jgi:lipopolysaccharide export system protein LptA/lipopolysaccharide export system protein LptC